MSEHVFISYRSMEGELDLALRLAADLKNRGVRAWIDKLELKPGDDWRLQIEEAVDECAALIAVVSPNYVSSKYCRREMRRADDRDCPIFPVLTTPRNQWPEDVRWPIEIQERQYVDFTNWQDENEYHQSLLRLLRVLSNEATISFEPVPNSETQYLTRLIAELEARRGVIEYVNLNARSDPQWRPDPHPNRGWLSEFVMLIESDKKSDEPVAVDVEELLDKVKISDIQKAIEKLPRFALIGEPGAGKTTTLRRLALEAARARLADPENSPLPLLLFLPQWKADHSFAEFVDQALKFEPGNNMILFLDGLNEMGEGGEMKAQQLRDWLAERGMPERVIVTCRAADYTATFNLNIPIIRAEPMEEEQIRQFANNYLNEKAANFLKIIMPADNAQRDSVRSLFRLARNPYLLSAMIYVYDSSQDGSLPRNTGALFQGLTRALWERERQRGTPGWVKQEDMEKAFSALAYYMVDFNLPVDIEFKLARELVGGEELLYAGRSANLIDIRGDQVRFYHQLTQEYFAAVMLQKVGVHQQLSKLERMKTSPYRKAQIWDQVIIALAGITQDPDKLIKTILDDDSILAAMCIGSGVQVSEAIAQETVEQLLHYFRLGYTKNDFWMARSAFITMGVPAVSFLIRFIENSAEPYRYAMMSVVGEIRSPTALPILIRLYEPDKWEAAGTIIQAVNKIDPPSLEKLAAKIDLAPDLAPLLVQIYGRWDIRWNILKWKLGRKREEIPLIQLALHDPSYSMRDLAKQMLGRLKP